MPTIFTNDEVEVFKREIEEMENSGPKTLFGSISTGYTYNPPQRKRLRHLQSVPNIKKVLFNNSATIVFWEDGTKTIVKCGDGDIYDPEKGLAMAISKKAYGNIGHYYEIFKKWVPREWTCSDGTAATSPQDKLQKEIDRIKNELGINRLLDIFKFDF